MRQSSQQVVLEQVNTPMQGEKISTLASHNKCIINLKENQHNIKSKAKTIKLLKENVEENLHTVTIDKDSIGCENRKP